MEILLVDDNALILARLEKEVKKLDESIVIHKAVNHEETLRLFSQFDPGFVILDISLPDGSGIDLLRSMKKENPQVIVFMFTNYGTDEFRKSCLLLGADQFFDKSDINRLIESIGLQYKILNKI